MSPSLIADLNRDLKKLSNPEKAIRLSGFFKTAKGQYGEGDKFLGITVPDQRKIAKQYITMSFSDLECFLQSPFHEYRLTALLILVLQYESAPAGKKGRIVKFYLNNLQSVNNWDLVDLTAAKILGDYLLKRDRTVLYNLAVSENLWEKRVSIVATYSFIRLNDFEDCLKISKILLSDGHDLINKAVGWMLREIGKRDQEQEEHFLKENIGKISRTTLRYAIEKFPVVKRKKYLAM